MQDVEVIINTVGVMSHDKQLMEAVHHHTPALLASIAKQQGVKSWVNLSALGADPSQNIAFVGSKGRGDQALIDLADKHFTVKIARPSLVFGLAKDGKKGGASTELFLTLARLPIIVLPDGGNFIIQPVHVDDVALGLVLLATKQTNCPAILNLTGVAITTLADYLRALRCQYHAQDAMIIIPISMPIAKCLASAARFFGLTMFSADSLALLEHGNTADNHALTCLLGRPPLATAECDKK